MRVLGALSKVRFTSAVAACALAFSSAAERAGAQTCGTPGERDPAAARASLAAAEQDATSAMIGMGFGETLPGIMSRDGALLLAGAPIIRGRESVLRALDASPYRSVKQSWQPLRVVVSRDGLFGATFGVSAIGSVTRASALGRYITAWRCNPQNSWEAVAHVDVRPNPPALRASRDIAMSKGDSLPQDAFARADLDFARMAADSGAPAAFARFVAPDGITFAGSGEINIGPANIRARMMESRAAAEWRWHPVLSFAAASGDLGATVGEAEIRVAGSPPIYTKYLSVWLRQPDGSLKFIVDGGNTRPPK